jgi:hypothetical protein
VGGVADRHALHQLHHKVRPPSLARQQFLRGIIVAISLQLLKNLRHIAHASRILTYER